jgi:hypothetical protein
MDSTDTAMDMENLSAAELKKLHDALKAAQQRTEALLASMGA